MQSVGTLIRRPTIKKINSCVGEPVDKIEEAECSGDIIEIILHKYVWIQVGYKVKVDGVIREDCEYFKCYYEIRKGHIYITKVGLNIADDGSVTDLD